MGNGMSPALYHSHAHSVSWVATDRCLNAHWLIYDTPTKGDIATIHPPLFQLSCQYTMGFIVLGHDKQPRRISIEAMNDARTQHTIDAR
jgi:hypothetical protein